MGSLGGLPGVVANAAISLGSLGSLGGVGVLGALGSRPPLAPRAPQVFVKRSRPSAKPSSGRSGCRHTQARAEASRNEQKSKVDTLPSDS